MANYQSVLLCSSDDVEYYKTQFELYYKGYDIQVENCTLNACLIRCSLADREGYYLVRRLAFNELDTIFRNVAWFILREGSDSPKQVINNRTEYPFIDTIIEPLIDLAYYKSVRYDKEKSFC